MSAMQKLLLRLDGLLEIEHAIVASVLFIHIHYERLVGHQLGFGELNDKIYLAPAWFQYARCVVRNRVEKVGEILEIVPVCRTSTV